MTPQRYDVLVVGAGHAGVEAAHAAAKLGASCALVTLSRQTIAQMSCNPAIGGLAKGQIVREIDALGGLMGLAADAAGIQFRMLNRSKGPAVWAPRAQADKDDYQEQMRTRLAGCDNLTILEDEIIDLSLDKDAVTGVVGRHTGPLAAATVVLTTGTFLRGLMHTGADQLSGGRYGEPASNELSCNLERIGLHLDRLKTGTPPRIDADSIDYDQLTRQAGDAEPTPFSFMNDALNQPQLCCWITYTNPHTHEIITKNLDQAPLYTGQIKSTGPRYCPSVETKVVRFADKERHQVFLEPEGRDSKWIYCNGISTSLPCNVQDEMVHSIVGLEHARILRYGYAIEYDYVPPLQIRATLESKKVPGLFLAGQINGTSGYEEAAAQGLIAGINAARKVAGKPLVTLGRDQAYIGVMIDDLVTRGVDEPYRMFTSRAEHRLCLRSDNADERLTPLGAQWGLVDTPRQHRYEDKQQQIIQIRTYLQERKLQGKPLADLLRRQDCDESWLRDHDGQLPGKRFDPTALQRVLHDIKYAGYVQKQQKLVRRFQRTEQLPLPVDFDYRQIPQLRCEAQEKLNHVQPISLGQASRISGINPADVTVLMIYMDRQRQQVSRTP